MNDQTHDTPTPLAHAGEPERSGTSATIGLGLLALYVVLLGIGTFAELFHIRWILDLPIY